MVHDAVGTHREMVQEEPCTLPFLALAALLSESAPRVGRSDSYRGDRIERVLRQVNKGGTCRWQGRGFLNAECCLGIHSQSPQLFWYVANSIPMPEINDSAPRNLDVDLERLSVAVPRPVHIHMLLFNSAVQISVCLLPRT